MLEQADALIAKIHNSRELGKRNFIVVVSEGMGKTYAEDLAKRIEEETGVETKFARFAHVVRGGTPTLRDRMIATRMGECAVEQLLDGKSNLVVCDRGGELVTSDISFALIVDRMYKGKLKDGDLDAFTAEQIEVMKAMCAKKKAHIASICNSVNKLGL